MIKLETMSYAEFGKLRFLDFFPKTDAYFYDGIAGTTCAIGYAAVDGYGFTGFASPGSNIGQTSEISVNFQQDCPQTEGETFLHHLGLELKKGMSADEIEALLGKSQGEDRAKLEYVLGLKWPYYLGCVIDSEKGLYHVWICRKDLADKETEYLKSI